MFPGMIRMIVDEIHKTVHEKDRDYFKRREKRLLKL